jgi:F0F1-type ATP synthase assembly protein I
MKKLIAVLRDSLFGGLLALGREPMVTQAEREEREEREAQVAAAPTRPIYGRVIGVVSGWLLAALIAQIHETTYEKLTGTTTYSEGLTYLIPLVLIGFLLGWLIDSNRTED